MTTEWSAPSVVVRDEFGPDDRRKLTVSLAGGDLVETGHDLGAGVSAAFGASMTEYEWEHRVRAADIPAAMAALGVHSPHLLVEVVAASLRDGERPDAFERIADAGVKVEFWSWID